MFSACWAPLFSGWRQPSCLQMKVEGTRAVTSSGGGFCRRDTCRQRRLRPSLTLHRATVHHACLPNHPKPILHCVNHLSKHTLRFAGIQQGSLTYMTGGSLNCLTHLTDAGLPSSSVRRFDALTGIVLTSHELWALPESYVCHEPCRCLDTRLSDEPDARVPTADTPSNRDFCGDRTWS